MHLNAVNAHHSSIPPIATLSATALKATLLSCGVDLSQRLLDNFGPPFLHKRRAYGNQDPLHLREVAIPQELLLSDEVICAINVKPNSPWLIDWSEEGYHVTHKISRVTYPVSFTREPDFYHKTFADNQRVNQWITLYGGRSLGVFVYGDCLFVQRKQACTYCSIQANRSKTTDFTSVIKPQPFSEALTLAIEHSAPEVNQIMINGGIFPDLDKSFLHYLKLVDVATNLSEASKRDIETHLISYPPKDLKLLEAMRDKPMQLAMNLEIADPTLFKTQCPGKADIYGQSHLYAALEKAVSVLGEGNVFSILVGGLEHLDTMEPGMRRLANMGVTPVINVFHADPQTPLENHPTPSVEEIMNMGSCLQQIYQDFPWMKPFYRQCGRNALDTEAYLGYFHQ